MMDVKDWTSVSFEEGRATLRQWREESVRRSEEVVELWEHVLSRRPSMLGDELWVIYEQVCIAALDCARTDVANECVTALRRQFPNSHRVHKLRAMQAEAFGKFEEALKSYENLIESDQANTTYRKRKVAVLKAQGRTKEAVAELCEYLNTFLNDNEAWLELTNLYLAEYDYTHAAHAMEELILAQPQNSLYLQRYADIRYTMGGQENVELAKQYFVQAANLHSANLRALYGVFQCCSTLCAKGNNPGKRKEYIQLAEWATQLLIDKYENEADCNAHATKQAQCVQQMMTALKAQAQPIDTK